MKVIFLDVDGVLNCQADFDKASKDQAAHQELGNALVGDRQLTALQWLVKSTGAKIVMSSTWRLGQVGERHRLAIHAILFSRGLEFIGMTGSVGWGSNRGQEIQNWLDMHGDVGSYVILDDINDMLPRQQDNFVQTSFSGPGLLMNHVDKAIEILNG